MKKFIFALTAIIQCLASPVLADSAGLYDRQAPNEIEAYANELGNLTDRFIFYNGPYHLYNEKVNGEDMNYVEYLKYASNIQLANPWEHFDACTTSGRCCGMSILSILAHNGVFSPSDIQEGKERMIDIEPDMYYVTMINDPVIRKIIAYQMRQDRPDFWLYMHQHFSEYDESETVDNLLETAQKAHDEEKYFLIILDDGDSQFSHAVTALGLVDGEWEYEGEKYDKCIPIYDTNLLRRCEDDETISYGCADDCSLFVNSETKKMYLPMYFEDGDVGENFRIFSLGDEDFMNYRGAINPSESYNTDVEGISSVTIKNYDKEYNLSVTREDGTVFDGISDCKRIFANKGREYVFKGKDFKVQNTANAENFGVNFMDINHAVYTDFQGAVNNIFYNSDEFNFDVSAPTEYDISLIFEEGSYKFLPHYKFDFSGNTDSDFKAIQTDRGVILSSSDGLECQVKINDVIRDENGLVSVVYTQGDSGSLSVNPEEKVQYEAISTLNDVLLTFDENGSLAYYIGENYDARVQKGDVNCDGLMLLMLHKYS